jgi:hypothetical protein
VLGQAAAPAGGVAPFSIARPGADDRRAREAGNRENFPAGSISGPLALDCPPRVEGREIPPMQMGSGVRAGHGPTGLGLYGAKVGRVAGGLGDAWAHSSLDAGRASVVTRPGLGVNDPSQKVWG